MTKFARIENDVIVEIFTSIAGDTPSDCFHPDVAATFVPLDDAAQLGWERNVEGDWAPPPPPPPPVPEPTLDPAAEVPPTVSRVRFKMLWTSAERIATKKLRATNEIVNDFWDLLDDPQTTEVVLSLPSVQAAIECTLTAIKAAGVDVDVPARKAAILSGVLS